MMIDKVKEFRQAALSDPNDEREISPQWLQGKLNEAADEIDRLRSELEAERGKVRELRAAIEKAKSIVYGGREVCDMMDKDVAHEYMEAANAFDKALANTTAPTEADKEDALREELSEDKKRITDLEDELRIIAGHLWREHYSEKSPDWQPLDYPEGLVSQINNMVAGLKPEAEIRAQRDREIADWLEVYAVENCNEFSESARSLTNVANELRQQND